MSELFRLAALEPKGATFSPDRRHRYTLWRDCLLGVDNVSTLVVIGLNPSTADEKVDDPTIRRCLGFARAWGFGRLVMLNLFAFRATDPADMKRAADPVGPENDTTLIAETKGRAVLCAWGADGGFLGRSGVVRRLLEGRDLRCLGRTKSGEPKHPLYLAAATKPEPLGGAS